ncbi:MAG: hypothetical protein BGO67_11755 [Alphaproteobacteria bacterium 41-28]|nr:MAG: hypothetical protein BGO67_11755 [Alphaproteobacteria bacterium 41-28]
MIKFFIISMTYIFYGEIMKKLLSLTFLVSFLLIPPTFAMVEGNDDGASSPPLYQTVTLENQDKREYDWRNNPPPHISIDEPEKLAEMIRQYREDGKPIGLAWACHTDEMPEKITEFFGSKVSAVENWISLDVSNCHIRMDATKKTHIKQVCNWLNEHGIKVSTIAFTCIAPEPDSSLVQKHILPIVKEDGSLIFPGYFPSHYTFNSSADCKEFGNLRVDSFGRLVTKYKKKDIDHFKSDLFNYHNPKGVFFHNEEAFLASTLSWIEEFTDRKGEAGKKLAAGVYMNRIIFFKPEHRVIENTFEFDGVKVNNLFSKSPDEFTRDYIQSYRDYLNEIGFDPSLYRICAKKPQADLFRVEEYVYPEDGTYDVTGHTSQASLVLIKK